MVYLGKNLEDNKEFRIDLAEASGFADSGTFSNYLSDLRKAGIIETKDGMVAPTKWLFLEGLI